MGFAIVRVKPLLRRLSDCAVSPSCRSYLAFSLSTSSRTLDVGVLAPPA